MFHMRQEIADRDANIRKMYKNKRHLQGFNYSYDMSSRRGINDGGSDMYDKGNIVSFSVNDNGHSISKNEILYDKTYSYSDDNFAFTSVKSHPFIALLWVAEPKHGDEFINAKIMVDSNTGADNYGRYEAGRVSSTKTNLTAHYFQVYGAGDPTICKVYTVIHKKQWNSYISGLPKFSYGTETNILTNSFEVTGKNFMIVYFLLAEKNNDKKVTTETIRYFLDEVYNFGNHHVDPDYLDEYFRLEAEKFNSDQSNVEAKSRPDESNANDEQDIRNATILSSTTTKNEESEPHTTTNYHDVPLPDLSDFSSMRELTSNCSYNLTTNYFIQRLRTPNYPEKYPPDAYCKWYIDVTEDCWIKFTINGKVEREYDYLKVSINGNAEIIDQELEYYSITKFVSKGFISVEFFSDSSQQYQGYEFAYEKLRLTTTQHPFKTNETTQTIFTTYEPYHGNNKQADSKYNPKAEVNPYQQDHPEPQNYSAVRTTTEQDITTDLPKAATKKLKTTTTHELYNQPQNYSSSQNYPEPQNHPDSEYFDEPQDYSVYSNMQSCGYNTTLTSKEQHIYTPGYQNYPNNIQCVWYINVPEDSYTSFTINGISDYNDYLTVTYNNGSATEEQLFWGRFYKKYFRSFVMKGTIKVVFDSSSSRYEKEYDFTFKKLPTPLGGTNVYESTVQTYNQTELPIDDINLFPSCRVSSIVDKFWKKCIQRKFLKSKKFKGASQCITDWQDMFQCGFEQLNNCTNNQTRYQLSYHTRHISRGILRWFDIFSNLSDGTDDNTELDVFCHHAPYGLQLPDMSDYGSTKEIEYWCKNDTATKIWQTFARGYRKQVWAKFHGDVFLNFPETIREVLETIEYDCASRRYFNTEYGRFFRALSAQFERVLNGVTPNGYNSNYNSLYDYYY